MANSKAKCKYCQDYFIAEKMIQQPVGRFCSTDHMMLFVKTKGARDRAEKAIQRARRKATQAAKKRLKTLHQYKSAAQSAVNGYIRVRDLGKPCISCGCVMSTEKYGAGRKMEAGHYRPRGSADHLRYHLLNIHGQCSRCNNPASHKTDSNYRVGLVARIGEKRVLSIDHDQTVVKWDKQHLDRMAKIFRKRTRIYQKLRGKV